MAKKTVPAKKVPVVQGDVFATFIAEAQSLGNEVVARRRFADELAAYLDERQLVDDFAEWRANRRG